MPRGRAIGGLPSVRLALALIARLTRQVMRLARFYDWLVDSGPPTSAVLRDDSARLKFRRPLCLGSLSACHALRRSRCLATRFAYISAMSAIGFDTYG